MLPSLKRTLHALGLMVCLSAHAQGTSACDQWLTTPTAPDQTLQQLLSQALSLELQCPRNAPFLYRLGSLLNQARRYSDALDRLEGALMRQPDHIPTQLEYVIALAGVGDTASAAGLLDNLAHNAKLDPDTLAQVQTMRASANAPASQPPTAWRLQATMTVGRDDNLLGNSDQTQFDLTLVDSRVPVETDPTQRPKKGTYVRTDLRFDAPLVLTPAALWRYSLVASQRNTARATETNFSHLGALLERQPLGDLGLYLSAQQQVLARVHQTELSQTQMGIGLEHRLRLFGQACRQRLLLDAQRTSYPNSPVLNGNYSGISVQTDCPASGLQVQARLGRDTPRDAKRPGAAQQQSSLRIAKSTAVGSAHLLLEAELAHQKDQAGYSPLLENNARRRLQRNNYRVEYSWPMGDLKPYISFSQVDGRANLPLFDVHNRVVALGLRAQW